MHRIKILAIHVMKKDILPCKNVLRGALTADCGVWAPIQFLWGDSRKSTNPSRAVLLADPAVLLAAKKVSQAT